MANTTLNANYMLR